MADALVDLVTEDEVSLFLDAAGQTAPGNLEGIITGVSAAVQQYLSRNLVSQPYSVVLNGEGGDRIFLPNSPITAVASLQIDGVAMAAAGGPTASGFVFNDNQVFLRGSRFCRGVQNIGLTYTGGYVEIPADVRHAVCEAILAVVAMLGADDPRAIELQAGDTKLKFPDLSAAQLSDFCLTPNVTAMLSQRRRVVPC